MSDDNTSNAPGSGDTTESERRAVAVSAYVDGEATPDEVRRIESDTVLLGDVRRLRALKDGVAAVSSLSPEHRDRLLAGALAEFDTEHGTASPPTSRSGASRWLAVAAAVVAVVATAGLAVSLVTTSDSDDIDAPTAGQAVDSPTEAEQNPLTPPADDTAGEMAGAEPEEDLNEDAESPDEGTVGEAPTAATTSAASDTASRAENFEELPDEQAMVDWVLQVQDGDLSPDGQGSFVCGREVLGVATYRGDEVVVAIEGNRVVARDTDTCGEVLSADAP
ncbi:MAG: hypothetical protein M3337_00415 [Actinomycetota bacterium]|nr:hypothetical protein [Actinomycetota bacterium]